MHSNDKDTAGIGSLMNSISCNVVMLHGSILLVDAATFNGSLKLAWLMTGSNSNEEKLLSIMSGSPIADVTVDLR